jgi:plasmid rolling circle replication initiator protein Rep
MSNINDYNTKKLRNQALLGYVLFINGDGDEVRYVSDAGYERIMTCGHYLEFLADAEVDKRKMINGRTCKNRFCPFCAWRKAKKDALIISTLMSYIHIEHEHEFIFLTLTVPNVPGVDLKSKVAEMNLAFKKLMKRKQFATINKGYIRKLEITYNPKRNDFHPHFHCCLAVDPLYFKKPKLYIKRDVWLAEWQSVMKDPSITQVDVRKMKISKQKDDAKDRGINEIAKYTAKDADYLHSHETFADFYNTLHGAQVFTYNKIFKDAMTLFKNGKLEKYKEIDPTEYIWNIFSQWGTTAYHDYEMRKMTDEEKANYNFKTFGAAEEEIDD